MTMDILSRTPSQHDNNTYTQFVLEDPTQVRFLKEVFDQVDQANLRGRQAYVGGSYAAAYTAANASALFGLMTGLNFEYNDIDVYTKSTNRVQKDICFASNKIQVIRNNPAARILVPTIRKYYSEPIFGKFSIENVCNYQPAIGKTLINYETSLNLEEVNPYLILDSYDLNIAQALLSVDELDRINLLISTSLETDLITETINGTERHVELIKEVLSLCASEMKSLLLVHLSITTSRLVKYKAKTEFNIAPSLVNLSREVLKQIRVCKDIKIAQSKTVDNEEGDYAPFSKTVCPSLFAYFNVPLPNTTNVFQTLLS